MLARRLIVLLGILVATAVNGAEDERISPLLLPAETLQDFATGDISEYRCPAGQSCQIACEAGPNSMKFEYAEVQRLEIARSATHWLLGLRAGGKDIQGLAPVPVGCRLEGFVMERVTPVTEVQVYRPIDARDIIFEIQPQ